MICLLIMGLLGDEGLHSNNPYTNKDDYEIHKKMLNIAMVIELIMEMYFIGLIMYIAG